MMIVFAFLNRLRGMFTWARVLISIIAGLTSFIITHNYLASTLIAILYFIALTSGWVVGIGDVYNFTDKKFYKADGSLVKTYAEIEAIIATNK